MPWHRLERTHLLVGIIQALRANYHVSDHHWTTTMLSWGLEIYELARTGLGLGSHPPRTALISFQPEGKTGEGVESPCSEMCQQRWRLGITALVIWWTLRCWKPSQHQHHTQQAARQLKEGCPDPLGLAQPCSLLFPSPCVFLPAP